MAAFSFDPSFALALPTMPIEDVDHTDVQGLVAFYRKYTPLNHLPDSLLGCGSWGTVYKATEIETGKVVAVKEAMMKDDPTLVREYTLLKAMRPHKSIMQVYDVFKCDFHSIVETPVYRMVMPLYDGGDLSQITRNFKANGKKIPEACVFKWLAQLAEGLDWMHNNSICKVVHRDLKSDNVIIQRTSADHMYDNVKIIDFGLASSTTHSQDLHVGTLAYQGPEAGHVGAYTDIWALGCILYELCTLTTVRKDSPPRSCTGSIDQLIWYQCNPISEVARITDADHRDCLTLHRAKNATFNSPAPLPANKYSPLLQYWLDRLLHGDYQKRADASELISKMCPDARKMLAIQYSWVESGHFDRSLHNRYDMPNVPAGWVNTQINDVLHRYRQLPFCDFSLPYGFA